MNSNENNPQERPEYSKRPIPNRPSYRQAKNKSRFMSIALLTLLIVVALGGAGWWYLNKGNSGNNESLIASSGGEDTSWADDEEIATNKQTQSNTNDLEDNFSNDDFYSPAVSAKSSASDEDDFKSIMDQLDNPNLNNGDSTNDLADLDKELNESSIDSDISTASLQDKVKEQGQSTITAPDNKSITSKAKESAQNSLSYLKEQGEKVKESTQNLLTKKEAEPKSIPPISVPEMGISSTSKSASNKVSSQSASNYQSNSSTDIVTVMPGDSLSSIARQVYGDGTKWKIIYEANRDKLKSPNAIFAGMKLVIPEN
ncbi:LysM peptidoglycan-binding domain-containing protein [Candidatus Nitrosacidococcus sp. I8]|uniref:LysM peptidoglycan-binding domain-containing protein n=1 Tax=Candidatus Nitrosacidococcus sp. I8 TaxID=2942908 RepID=UPI00222777E1|nr:LysM peptidoglycan-binding domain-containing protein [Candidatus Nitrosacidococcus sp. I8]CAH9018988.1 hypothetical protein NURINAE_01261 [Candidatus Nitrosacidococcus sp. I8]